MIDNSLLEYFTVTRCIRRPHGKPFVSCDDIFWARALAEQTISEIIAGPDGRLKQLAIAFAVERNFVIPLEMRR